VVNQERTRNEANLFQQGHVTWTLCELGGLSEERLGRSGDVRTKNKREGRIGTDSAI